MRCKALKTIQVDAEVYTPGSHVQLKDDDALALAEKGLVEFDPSKEELAAEAEAKKKAEEETKARAEAEAKAKAAAK